FRVTRATFDLVVELVRVDMEPPVIQFRTPVPLQKRVGLLLCKLATAAEYRVVGNVFGVHKSTVHRYLHMFCCSLVHRNMSTYIAMPDEREAQTIAQREYDKYGLPQIMVAIDGTHIPIAAPLRHARDYLNCKFWAS
ncbi:UNVERIFIED_CONTAM: hypothetical protein FKN15_062237, partial [Acipenser sinensis]